MDAATPLVIPQFVSTTLGVLVFLVGALITRRVGFLRDYNIPEPVSGGLVAAAITWAIFLLLDRTVEFELGARDYFLVVFFSCIGLNARLADLVTGGKPLVILLILTVLFIFFQNVVGIATALAFGLPVQIGALLGSAALIGGHGTVIAWSPLVAEKSQMAGAAELGVAMATIGLVVAALLGGPVSKYLIERNHLTPARPDEVLTSGIPFEDEAATRITHIDLMRIIFFIHLVIIAGYSLHGAVSETGLKLPLFVPCMLVGILVGNLLPVLLPRMAPVPRTPTLGLVSDFALGIFLAMSLMSLQLWTLEGLGLLMITNVVLQSVMAIIFVVFLIFRLMGSGYRAAVLAGGFIGFGLGATPTAIANMSAVTKRYGPSPVAFVVLPLVSAFFVDLANSAAIQAILFF